MLNIILFIIIFLWLIFLTVVIKKNVENTKKGLANLEKVVKTKTDEIISSI